MALARDPFCEQGLSRPRRAKEQDALRGFVVEFFEDFGIAQTALDNFDEGILGLVKTRDIIPRDIRDFDEDFPQGAGLDDFPCSVKVGSS